MSHRIDDLKRFNVDGTQYGLTRGNFRARWWNFYERGRSFADGGFWKEAESDLRNALSGRSNDNRLSRTYGLHFIPYFGNRELGIVLYHQGQLKEAVWHLKRSLEDDPTEKAEFYLNECQLELSKVVNDLENPTLQINELPEVTNSSKLTLAGTAVDNQFVDAVMVNGRISADILKKKRYAFEEEVKLTQGVNDIEIMATDTFGNKAFERRTVVLDYDPPLISINSASPEQLVLTVTDQDAVKLVEDRLENLKLMDEKGNQFTFQPVPNADVYYVEFEDAAQNRNGMKIDPQYIQLGYQINRSLPFERAAPSPVLLASSKITKGLLSKQNSSDPGPDSKPGFSIEVEGLLPEMKVFQDHIIVAGRVHGELEYLKFNNQIRLRNKKNTRFSFKQPLEMGHNSVVLEALDSTNSKHIRTFQIERLTTPKMDRELRAIIMLYPLAREGGDRGLGSGEYHNLLVELDESERFRLLEKERLDLIQQEFDLVTEGLVKDATAAKLGKKENADYTLACTIRPTKDDVEIFGRLIDTDTKKILTTCDVYELVKGNSDFADTYTRFVNKLIQEFPVIECKVKEKTTSKLIIGVGKDANAKKGMRFVGYHRTDPIIDSETGEIIIQGKIVIDGKLSARAVENKVAHLTPHGDSKIHQTEHIVSQ